MGTHGTKASPEAKLSNGDDRGKATDSRRNDRKYCKLFPDTSNAHTGEVELFPASTHKGQAVLGFPDVCKTPNLGAPTPIAYPNIGTTAAATKTPTATKPATATKTPTATMTATAPRPAFPRTSGSEAGVLRGQLSTLHQKLMTMPAGDTTKWHAVVDDYVMKSADLYKALASTQPGR